MNREYYWEYLQDCDQLVDSFLKKAKKVKRDVFMIEGINLENPVKNFLWESIFFGSSRNTYSEMRSKELDYVSFIQSIWKQKIQPLLPNSNKHESFVIKKSSEQLAPLLEPFRNTIVFYCINNRQLNYYRPILEKIDEPIVILTRENIGDDSFMKPNIQFIEYDLIFQDFFIKNKYFEENFSYIFFLSNSLLPVIHDLSPRCVVIFEGCHFETEIVSSICKFENIPTICIQQGWPSLMHTRFQNMSYDYFLTWGKAFNKLWGRYNPAPTFKEVGCLYSIRPPSNKTGIAFFFQAPLFIIDEFILDVMMKFFIHCAERYKDRKIYLREHPEYKLSPNKISDLKQYPNIGIVSDWEISMVFSQSEIGVSVFSSTLMEGIVHDTIPFVFNLTSYPNYYPDLEKDGIGLEAKSINEAILKIEKLIENKKYRETVKRNILAKKTFYFKAYNSECINNIYLFLKERGLSTSNK